MEIPGGSGGKESACNAGDLSSISGLENPLEGGMATHSSILAWRKALISLAWGVCVCVCVWLAVIFNQHVCLAYVFLSQVSFATSCAAWLWDL